MKYVWPIIAAMTLAACSDQNDKNVGKDDFVTPSTPAPPIRDLLKCALRTRNLDRPTDPSMDIGNRVFIDLDTTGYTKVSKLYTGSTPDPDRYRIAWNEENGSPQVFRTDDIYDVGIFNGGKTQQGVKKSSRYDGKLFCFGRDTIDTKVGSFSQTDRLVSWMNYARPFGKLRNACFSGIDLQTMEYFSTTMWFSEEGDCQRY